MEQNQQEILQARYGLTKSRSRRKTRNLAILGIALMTVIAGLFGYANWNPIEARDVGFRVQSPWQTELDFELQMPPGSIATCEFEALNNSFTQVGFRRAEFGPFETATTAHTIGINTYDEAVTALVRECRLR